MRVVYDSQLNMTERKKLPRTSQCLGWREEKIIYIYTRGLCA